jgi:predicted adenylyl cyclase CyaB
MISPPNSDLASNVEIKARIQDRLHTEQKIKALCVTPAEVLKQVDTFFEVPNGRLKLRIINDKDAELILYNRENTTKAKRSDYLISKASDPVSLGKILSETLSIKGVVEKTRTLFLVGQTRIHLDRVAGLGDFIELEFVLSPGQPLEEGFSEISEIRARLGISECDLISEAYVDLLPPQTKSKSATAQH